MPSTAATAAKGAQDVEDDEEDYMSMTIVEPQEKETFAQRKLRKQREVGTRFFSSFALTDGCISVMADCLRSGLFPSMQLT